MARIEPIAVRSRRSRSDGARVGQGASAASLDRGCRESVRRVRRRLAPNADSSTSPTIRRGNSIARSTRPSPRTGRSRPARRSTVRASHGGSGAQARAVIDGLERRRGDAGARRRHRRDRASRRRSCRPTGRSACRTIPRPTPRRSCSWSARAIRRAIKDWDDLAKPGIQVITPNPKTSGGARWNYLAAWGYAARRSKDAGEGAGLRRRRSTRTCRCSTPARAARPSTFAQRGIGDVLDRLGERGLPQPQGIRRGQVRHRRAVDLDPRRAAGRARRRQRRREGHPQGRRRPISSSSTRRRRRRSSPSTTIGRAKPEAAAKEDLERLPKLKLFTIDEVFGGWAKAQKAHFDDGGIFDAILKANR